MLPPLAPTPSWGPICWLRMPSCMPPGPRPTRRSLCSDLSSWTCLVNWLRGLAPVEHSAPPRKDMLDVDVDVEVKVLRLYAVRCWGAVSNATKEHSMVQAGGIAGRQRHRHRQRQRQHAPAYSSATHGWGSAVGLPRGRGRARLPLGATKRRLVCVHG